jgi:hypothetical protein
MTPIDRQDARKERIPRKVVAPVVTLLMIVIAALIWRYGSPNEMAVDDPMVAPLPQCGPGPGEKVTI